MRGTRGGQGKRLSGRDVASRNRPQLRWSARMNQMIRWRSAGSRRSAHAGFYFFSQVEENEFTKKNFFILLEYDDKLILKVFMLTY